LGKTLGEIDAMPYADFLEFQEFYVIEPFGLPAQDAMNALQISYKVNMARGEKDEIRPFKDFLLFPPYVEPVPDVLVDGKTAAQWRMIFAAEAMQAAHARGQ